MSRAWVPWCERPRSAQVQRPAISAIFLDVDEVLVDWVSDALAVLGYDADAVMRAWVKMDPRPWNLFDVIGVEPAMMWAHINDHGAEFWAQLKPFPWMHDLLALCRELASTTLVTSPAPLPACHAGKAQWMQDTFGADFRDYALTSVKHRFAHPGALLIDDSPKNCDAFRAHGGHAILFPGVGNDLHHVPGDERVAYVREQLRGYTFPHVVTVSARAFEEHVALGGNPRTAPGFAVSMPIQPPSCNHGVTFDSDAAMGLGVAEVRKRWPRLNGPCPLGCGFSGIAYASRRHFIVGDW